eukprot:CAMPEP_0169469880 /NCGR_PEP_ID=MMETSP1042-20121227/23716_1 /TAXON_ID=464988 /ORGANISM="Hemiselmis andersenii, Strain CCMP1180" /LENGTH=219 /DNA_ID=CAMNT_0009583387 /DNA_START=1 /DNA_END=656 /DNA_ORIENTATION=+
MSMMDQIARALRDGDLGDQASVEVHVMGCKNLPATGSYVVAQVEKDVKQTGKVVGTNSPSFDEKLKVPVLQRRSDLLVIKVLEAPSDAGAKLDPATDRVIGKVELQVASFGRAADDTWSGTKQATVDLLDEHGQPVYRTGTRVKSQVEVKLKFLEGATKRAQVLEGQLDAVKQLQTMTDERLKGKEKEVESLRADLDRKTEDLAHIVAERNKMREELHR